MNFPDIYLASASPRRAELLQQIGVPFTQIYTSIDETVLPNDLPLPYVERMATAKALAGLEYMHHQLLPAKPVLGADTAVILKNGEILGKPNAPEQASAYLRKLSGKTHFVISAVALADDRGFRQVRSQKNAVTFCTLSAKTISDYVATQEGMDKAGSYAIQGIAAMFITSIKGSFSGIMGLPLYETRLLLDQVKHHE